MSRYDAARKTLKSSVTSKKERIAERAQRRRSEARRAASAQSQLFSRITRPNATPKLPSTIAAPAKLHATRAPNSRSTVTVHEHQRDEPERESRQPERSDGRDVEPERHRAARKMDRVGDDVRRVRKKSSPRDCGRREREPRRPCRRCRSKSASARRAAGSKRGRDSSRGRRDVGCNVRQRAPAEPDAD